MNASLRCLLGSVVEQVQQVASQPLGPRTVRAAQDRGRSLLKPLYRLDSRCQGISTRRCEREAPRSGIVGVFMASQESNIFERTREARDKHRFETTEFGQLTLVGRCAGHGGESAQRAEQDVLRVRQSKLCQLAPQRAAPPNREQPNQVAGGRIELGERGRIS